MQLLVVCQGNFDGLDNEPQRRKERKVRKERISIELGLLCMR